MPIGTILPYIGTLKTIPHGWFLCDGNNGTPDLQNRFLEGSGIRPATTIISPGLPNITGIVTGIKNNDMTVGTTAIGVFNGSYSYHDVTWAANSTGNRDTAVLTFDASKSNHLYGLSDTVQPAAYVVHYIIRLK